MHDKKKIKVMGNIQSCLTIEAMFMINAETRNSEEQLQVLEFTETKTILIQSFEFVQRVMIYLSFFMKYHMHIRLNWYCILVL